MKEARHIASLDGLRGLAALAVVASHVPLVFPALGPFPFPDIGSYAVEIFFALSGFLMAYLYAHRPLTLAGSADFLVSRFARIYPVYVVAVIVVASLSQIPGMNYIHPIYGFTQIIRHVLLLGSTGVLWSVSPEIQFYLLFPVIWMFLGNPRRYQSFAIALAFFLAIDALLGFPGSGILLPSKLPYFLFGTLVGHAHQRWNVMKPNVLAGILALALPVFLLTFRALLPTSDPLWGTSSAFAAALAVSLAAMEHRISATVFAWPPLRFVGTISFSLYLFHVPCLFIADKALHGVLPMPLVIAIGLIFALWAGCVSFYVIEMPSRRLLVSLWKNRHAKARKNIGETAARNADELLYGFQKKPI